MTSPFDQARPGRSANRTSRRHTSERGLLIKNQGQWQGWALTVAQVEPVPGMRSAPQVSKWTVWLAPQILTAATAAVQTRARPSQSNMVPARPERSADNVARVVESTPFYTALISLPRRRLQYRVGNYGANSTCQRADGRQKERSKRHQANNNSISRRGKTVWQRWTNGRGRQRAQFSKLTKELEHTPVARVVAGGDARYPPRKRI